MAKSDFYFGILVALHTVRLYDNPTMAKDIVDGCGIEGIKKAAVRSDSECDDETIRWLHANGIN